MVYNVNRLFSREIALIWNFIVSRVSFRLYSKHIVIYYSYQMLFLSILTFLCFLKVLTCMLTLLLNYQVLLSLLFTYWSRRKLITWQWPPVKGLIERKTLTTNTKKVFVVSCFSQWSDTYQQDLLLALENKTLCCALAACFSVLDLL